MLATYIPKLIQDLELGDISMGYGIPGTYTLPLEDNLAINMTDIPSGFILKCNVGPYPKIKEELFATQAMLGNLFGQGTRGAYLGLNGEGTILTLTHVIDYPVDYKEFKETLEDFINTMDFWREEASNPTPLQ